jgi:hypothetical protein
MTDGRLTVHELGPARAEGLAAYLAGTPDWRAMLQPVDGPAICVVDFVNNHGHHLLNHLSGLQRLVDEGLVDKPDAIWTRGQMHFGPPGRLFPEFADRLRHFGSQEDLRAALNATRGTKLRIGSNFFNAALRSRILGTNAFLSARSARGPVVCFTLRVAGRQCLNLEESILRIMQAVLERWPDAQVVFDGWTSHDDLAGVSSAISAYKASPYAKNIDAETAMVQSLAERLPPGVVRRNLVGYPMSETISVLQAVDFYFAHTGTIQHKIGFLTDAVGLIHGPRLAVSDPEAGAYCTEIGNPPTQLAAELVEDVGEPSPRGARSNDYRIADPDRVAQLCCEMIAQARPDLLAAGAAGRATP